MAISPPAPARFQVRVDVQLAFLRWDKVPEKVNAYEFEKYTLLFYFGEGEHDVSEYSIYDINYTSHVLGALDPARRYGYRIGATYKIAGTEERKIVFGDYIACRSLRDPAPVPANLKVRRSFNEIHISWDKVADTHERRKFETYHLVRYEKNVATPVHVATKETKYVDKDVKGGKEYAYCIASHYGAEEDSKGVNFAMSEYTPNVKHIFVDYKLAISITTE